MLDLHYSGNDPSRPPTMRMAPATPVFAGEPAPTGAVQVSRFWLRQLLLQVGHKPWGRRCSCGNGRALSHSDRARFQGFR
ncbi:hypothetical protein C1882_10000 [Pseudomonas sp. FW305-E2]|nr:hypothetical protein C1882_10000 [Pseudomonas sp. FW305-E2]